MNKKELDFRKYLRGEALYETYEWIVCFYHDYHVYDGRFPIFKGLFIENIDLHRKLSYKKIWGLFRKTYLKQFDYILTDSWEDLEYKFAYHHLNPCGYALRNGEWINIKGGHDTIFYKPVYKQRTFEELAEIRLSNKDWLFNKPDWYKGLEQNEQKENKE